MDIRVPCPVRPAAGRRQRAVCRFGVTRLVANVVDKEPDKAYDKAYDKVAGDRSLGPSIGGVVVAVLSVGGPAAPRAGRTQ